MHTPRTNVLVASFLEPELVERVRAVDPRLAVVYEPRLLAPPRYPADHVGGPFTRPEADEAEWRSLLADADILFDFDRPNAAELPDLAPGVRWIQATSAGIGQFVAKHDYARRMPGTVFTTASGVHARPLAEFCAMAILGHSRGLFRILEWQRERHWERFAGTDLEGRTVVIYGHGAIGTEVGRICRALGMRVIGVKRTPEGDPAALHADELHGPDGWEALLPRADVLVLAAPHTPETERVVGAAELAALPGGALIVNIGRGALIDEPALVEGLGNGRPAAAALDVFEEEPLPPESPLWSMPNVLVSPHSASTSDRENARITDLFCDNLRRRLAGEPLRNVLDPERRY